ncbi:MAG: L-seryl-tRNA(ser) selenium transferase protein [Chitinophagaceae bacterium]|nr:L-seryl-tRNA(ser) selenium transferase protein [Chitinophagaceae bacterium]
MKRRDIIKGLTVLPFAGGIAGSIFPYQSVLGAPSPVTRDLFKELGVRTFINAAGTYTFMTGSLMHDYVIDTIKTASKEFCLLDDLQDKVGEKIAAMVHAEAAVVTCGAFSGLTLGLAGILTGTDVNKVKLLPQLEGSGMKSEVIVQKAHSIDYNHALTNTGCKMVEVETVADVEKAINEKTAMMFFLNIEADKGKIMHEEWVALAKKNKIPTGIDIAADVPPVSNLWKFHELGFDFVVISGGKAIRGPQSAGLLMGKKDIIAGARLHMPPRGFNIGRGMKVNKEEVLGMYVALEHYLSYDHDKEWKTWENNIAVIENAAKSDRVDTTIIFLPPLGNITPTLEISWSNPGVKSKDLQEKLRYGSPSIEVMSHQDNSIIITVWVMKQGEEKIVARRLKEELTAILG